MGQGHSMPSGEAMKRSKSRQSTRSLPDASVNKVKKSKSMGGNDTKLQVYDGAESNKKVGMSNEKDMDYNLWCKDSAPYYMPSKVKGNKGPRSLDLSYSNPYSSSVHQYNKSLVDGRTGDYNGDGWSDVASDLYRIKRKPTGHYQPSTEYRSKRTTARKPGRSGKHLSRSPDLEVHKEVNQSKTTNLECSPGNSLRRHRSSKSYSTQYDSDYCANSIKSSNPLSSHSVHESVSSYAPRHQTNRGIPTHLNPPVKSKSAYEFNQATSSSFNSTSTNESRESNPNSPTRPPRMDSSTLPPPPRPPKPPSSIGNVSSSNENRSGAGTPGTLPSLPGEQWIDLPPALLEPQAPLGGTASSSRNKGKAEDERSNSQQSQKGNGPLSPPKSPGSVQCDKLIIQSLRVELSEERALRVEAERHAIQAEKRQAESDKKLRQITRHQGSPENAHLSMRIKELESELRQTKDKMEHIEDEKRTLHQEHKEQQEAYDKWLDDIATQVAKALIQQKSLKCECSRLQKRLFEVEWENRLLRKQMQLSSSLDYNQLDQMKPPESTPISSMETSTHNNNNSNDNDITPAMLISKRSLISQIRQGMGSDPNLLLSTIAADMEAVYSSGESCSSSSIHQLQPSQDASPLSTAGEGLCSRPESFLMESSERCISLFNSQQQFGSTASALASAFINAKTNSAVGHLQKQKQIQTENNTNSRAPNATNQPRPVLPPRPIQKLKENIAPSVCIETRGNNDIEDEEEDEKPRNYAQSKGDGEDGSPAFRSLRIPLATTFKQGKGMSQPEVRPRVIPPDTNILSGMTTPPTARPPMIKGRPPRGAAWGPSSDPFRRGVSLPQENLLFNNGDGSCIERLRKSGNSGSSIRSTTTTVHNFMKGAEDLLEKDEKQDDDDDDEQQTSTPKASPENGDVRDGSMDADGSLTPTLNSMTNLPPLDLSPLHSSPDSVILSPESAFSADPSTLDTPPHELIVARVDQLIMPHAKHVFSEIEKNRVPQEIMSISDKIRSDEGYSTMCGRKSLSQVVLSPTSPIAQTMPHANSVESLEWDALTQNLMAPNGQPERMISSTSSGVSSSEPQLMWDWDSNVKTIMSRACSSLINSPKRKVHRSQSDTCLYRSACDASKRRLLYQTIGHLTGSGQLALRRSNSDCDLLVAWHAQYKQQTEKGLSIDDEEIFLEMNCEGGEALVELDENAFEDVPELDVHDERNTSRQFQDKYYNLYKPGHERQICSARAVLANTSSSFSSEDSEDDGATTVQLWVKQLKYKGGKQVVRYLPPTWRKSITQTKRVFARFGAPERDALASFDFLRDNATSVESFNASVTYRPGGSLEQLNKNEISLENVAVQMRKNKSEGVGCCPQRRSRSMSDLPASRNKQHITPAIVYENVPFSVRKRTLNCSSSSSSEGELNLGLGGSDWYGVESSSCSSGGSLLSSANSSLLLSDLCNGGRSRRSSSSSISLHN